MKIETERLQIRPIIMDDMFDMHELFSLAEVMQPLGMAPAFIKIEESQKRISDWIKDEKYHGIVLKGIDKVIGYIVIKPDSEENREDTRELGFALNPNYQHQGYMTETVTGVCKFLKEVGITFVWACCFKNNLSSKKLIERCGFEFQNSGEFYAKTEERIYESLEFRMNLKQTN